MRSLRRMQSSVVHFLKDYPVFPLLQTVVNVLLILTALFLLEYSTAHQLQISLQKLAHWFLTCLPVPFSHRNFQFDKGGRISSREHDRTRDFFIHMRPFFVYFLKISNSGFSRVLMTMSIVIFHIEPLLAPDDVTSKTVFVDFLAPKNTKIKRDQHQILPREPNSLNFSVFWGEKVHKNRFRRDVVWSQQRLNMKNDYAHRHQHP
ncbi:hypothetical protein PRIPAC_81978 [Pristionchus pacificus]|uniref:Uncharacterized protein n=1 Tax=Pristionchus pacificus TaxID=54126 RepID=A0A2A6C2D5_PRIPA|nr:hypothetical protein PRIPAC_81978 [Pristionchus pacificus]|eukprot:PDM72257.1 hypothetical protein PRIPAC_38691 [Pristionchus pacificus]